MIVRKILVNTVDEAQARINEELGPNAVILMSRHIKYTGLKALFFSNKIEIVAAVNGNDYNNYKDMKEEKEPFNSEHELSKLYRLTENLIEKFGDKEHDSQYTA